MIADIIPLICYPKTHDGLELQAERNPHSRSQEAIRASVDLLSPGMQEVQVRNIAGSDLYRLSFRKPR